MLDRTKTVVTPCVSPCVSLCSHKHDELSTVCHNLQGVSKCCEGSVDLTASLGNGEDKEVKSLSNNDQRLQLALDTLEEAA